MEQPKQEIKFQDLDVWLKIAVIGSYVLIGLTIISFITGYIIGVSSAS